MVLHRTLKKHTHTHKLRGKSNRRKGRGKESSYRIPFAMSLPKLSNFTRKKEVPAATEKVSVSVSSLKKGKSNITKKVAFDQESKAWQNICHPNKKVIFTKGHVPAFEYLDNINIEGSLGCTIKTFPKYENGKYCCMSEPASKQEHLDFINSLLEAAMNNVSDTAFIKQRTNIYLLLRSRNLLLRNKKLIDTLEVIEPYTSITDWFRQTEERAGNEISRNRPDVLIDDDPIHMRIQDEVARNRIKNNDYMLELKTNREKKEKATQAKKTILDLWKSRASTLVNKARTLMNKPLKIVSVK
jgi:hypothetical protein